MWHRYDNRYGHPCPFDILYDTFLTRNMPKVQKCMSFCLKNVWTCDRVNRNWNPCVEPARRLCAVNSKEVWFRFSFITDFCLFDYIWHQNRQIWCGIEVLAWSGTSCVYFRKFYRPNSVGILWFMSENCGGTNAWLRTPGVGSTCQSCWNIVIRTVYRTDVSMIRIVSKNVNDMEP